MLENTFKHIIKDTFNLIFVINIRWRFSSCYQFTLLWDNKHLE